MAAFDKLMLLGLLVGGILLLGMLFFKVNSCAKDTGQSSPQSVVQECMHSCEAAGMQLIGLHIDTLHVQGQVDKCICGRIPSDTTR